MKLEFSAGGVIYKKENDKVWIIVAKHSFHHGWVFPKGLIGDHIENESKEETAIREVEEETGVKGKIIKELTPVTFWYEWEGEKRKKTIYYFLMEYLYGDIAKHDFEMEEVEWLSKDEVLKRLTYESDKKVFQEAEKLI